MKNPATIVIGKVDLFSEYLNANNGQRMLLLLKLSERGEILLE